MCIALAVILVIAVAVLISVAVAILISAAVVAGKLWKFPPESSWRQLGGSTASPGQLLEMPWRLPEVLGEPLARLGRSGDRPGRVSGALGVILGAYKRCLGHSLGRLGAILGAKRAPEGSSRGAQIELKRRLELKNAKPQHFVNISQNSFTFKVRAGGGQILCKMWS